MIQRRRAGPERSSQETSRARWRLPMAPMSSSAAAMILASPALGQSNPLFTPQQFGESQGLIGLSFVVALVLITSITALLHLTGRRQWTRRESELVADAAQLRARLDRAQVFLSAEPQIIVAWGSANGEPEIEGDLSLVTEAPVARRVLGFGSWLAPEAAQEFEGYVERLRQRGEGFRLSVTSLAGRHLEAEGRAVGGAAGCGSLPCGAEPGFQLILRLHNGNRQFRPAVIRRQQSQGAAEAQHASPTNGGKQQQHGAEAEQNTGGDMQAIHQTLPRQPPHVVAEMAEGYGRILSEALTPRKLDSDSIEVFTFVLRHHHPHPNRHQHQCDRVED